MDDIAIRLPVRRVARVLWWTVVVLGLLSLAAQFMTQAQVLGHVQRFFNSDQKLNFPSVFKEVTLLASTVLFALIATAHRRGRLADWKHWWLLAGAFAFLTLDEMTYAHQSLTDFLEPRLETRGIFEFAWILLYVPATIALVAILIPFVRRLQADLRRRLLLASALFVLGAGGFEIIKGSLFDKQQFSLWFGIAATTSDTLQMAGLSLLIVVLLTELARLVPTLHVQVDVEDHTFTEGPSDAEWADLSRTPAPPARESTTTWVERRQVRREEQTAHP